MNQLLLLGGGFGLPETVALAAVAVIGYVFGRRRKDGSLHAARPAELLHATQIAQQLEQVAKRLRSDLAAHQSEIERFKSAVNDTDLQNSEASLRSIQAESDRVLAPTLRLVTQVASAYDQIRRQSHALSEFSGGRTDKLTGLHNSRALSELLQIELADHAATGGRFSIAIFGSQISDDGQPENRSEQQARLLQVIELLRAQVRDTDLIARYGIDDLVVVMPHTRLYGAGVFGRRTRSLLGDAGVTVSCGLTHSMPEDTAVSLLARADSALYSAKASSKSAQFFHTGQAIRADVVPTLNDSTEQSLAEQPPTESVAAEDSKQKIATTESLEAEQPGETSDETSAELATALD